MARRIAAAILLTLWVMLLSGGLTAYMLTRSMLLADFDQTLIDRATALAAHHGAATGTADSFPDDRFIIENQHGHVWSSPAAAAANTPLPTPIAVGKPEFATLAQGQRIRRITLRVPGPAPDGLLTIVYSSSTESIDRILYRLAMALGISGLAAGILATYVAVKVSRAALHPLHQTADLIGTIDDAHLDRRIDSTALPRELAPMAQHLNAMLERLEQSFAQRKQFLADASHELRTPIAALLTTIEVAVRRPHSETELRHTLASCLGDARMLRQLVESLMQQARSENFQHDEPIEVVDVGVVLQEAVHLAQALALEKNVEIHFSNHLPLVINSQASRMRSIIRNILNNAVEHNRQHGSVEIKAAIQNDELIIFIKDTGLGIPPEHLPHLFEPFYRADKVRSDDGNHLGLGLFLVQSHLKAIGGSCQVQSELGAGTEFRVRISNGKPSSSNRLNLPILSGSDMLP